MRWLASRLLNGLQMLSAKTVRFVSHLRCNLFPRMLGILLCLSITACASPRKVRPQPAKLAASNNTSYAEALFILHNHFRNFHGADSLQRDPQLFNYAQAWAETMARTGKMKHSSLRFVGADFRSGAENVAFGQKTPQQAMTSWMESWGHRRNILNHHFAYTGFGVAYDSAGRAYWCAVFAR
jgi:uncharacterized protein YkwD